MSVTQKLKWKRALSRLKFSYEEAALLKEISRDSAAEFQEYYEVFCAKNDVDIEKSNKDNKERIDKLYGRRTEDPLPPPPPPENEVDNTALSVYDGTGDPIEAEANEEYQMTKDELEMHDIFSKLFKKIALSIHPDRIDRTLPEEQIADMASKFRKANRALDERKYFVLLELADSLKITTPRNYSQQTRWMKKQIGLVESSIAKEKSTYNYLFSEAETEEEKDNLIKKFLFQLFRIQA